MDNIHKCPPHDPMLALEALWMWRTMCNFPVTSNMGPTDAPKILNYNHQLVVFDLLFPAPSRRIWFRYANQIEPTRSKKMP